ncbi:MULTISPECIES: phosphonatase-like hydrolase [Arthrobacter]|uniref:Phosphonatase-like hydrolase n=2 Tax=Arthrobacter TaxID=1663 RepID=A0ABU9KKN7_9MICC|nr:phosphonatase-like hydrolase [Arthrobacter sp. YJM1]MDP5227470.1 phosphonatase-like hydrolase [Arthrobacter sp. YJM1]
MTQLVACDMAGTTIDEHGDVYRALARSVEENGVPTTDQDVQTWMGADKVEAITALLKIGGHPADEATVAKSFQRFLAILAELYTANPPTALPGVEESLRGLRERGVKVALTTGFSADVAGPLLESLNWKLADDDAAADAALVLDAVVTSDEVSTGRPAPFMIHRAMERTGVLDVRQVIAAGDTVVDLLAAHHAGVRGVGVLTGKLGREELAVHPHEAILESVADLPGIA